jgi:hypothetical protein
VREARVLEQRPERLFLIARERLGRKQVERPRVLLAREAVEHRQVVAEALSGGGRGGDHQALVGAGERERLRLVRVELLDPAGLQRLTHLGREIGGEVGVTAGLRRHHVVERERAVDARIAAPALQHRVDPARVRPRIWPRLEESAVVHV